MTKYKIIFKDGSKRIATEVWQGFDGAAWLIKFEGERDYTLVDDSDFLTVQPVELNESEKAKTETDKYYCDADHRVWIIADIDDGGEHIGIDIIKENYSVTQLSVLLTPKNAENFANEILELV